MSKGLSFKIDLHMDAKGAIHATDKVTGKTQKLNVVTGALTRALLRVVKTLFRVGKEHDANSASMNAAAASTEKAKGATQKLAIATDSQGKVLLKVRKENVANSGVLKAGAIAADKAKTATQQLTIATDSQSKALIKVSKEQVAYSGVLAVAATATDKTKSASVRLTQQRKKEAAATRLTFRLTKGLKSAINAATAVTKRGSKAVANHTNELRKMARESANAHGKTVMLAAGGTALAATMVAAAITQQAVMKAADKETATVQLIAFTGSLEKAKKKMAELSQFAKETPFELPSIQATTRMLYAYTDAAKKSDLLNIGNAAATAGREMQDVAMWYGRLKKALATGGPIGEARAELQQMGLGTKEAWNEMERLVATQAKVEDKMAGVDEMFGKYEGAMQRLSGTLNGRLSTMRDNWSAMFAAAGNAGPMEATKVVVSEITKRIEALTNNKQRLAQVGELMTNGMVFTGKAMVAVIKTVLWMQRTWENLRAVFAFVYKGAIWLGENVKGGFFAVGQAILGFLGDITGKARDTVQEAVDLLLNTVGENKITKTLVKPLESMVAAMDGMSKQYGTGAAMLEEYNRQNMTQAEMSQKIADDFLQQTADRIVASEMMAANVEKTVGDVLTKMEDASKKARDEMLKAKDGTKEVADESKKAAEEVGAASDALIKKAGNAAQKMLAALGTPAEKIRKEMAQVSLAMKHKWINAEQYQRLMVDLTKKLFDIEHKDSLALLDMLDTQSVIIQRQIDALTSSAEALVESGRASGEQIQKILNLLKTELSQALIDEGEDPVGARLQRWKEQLQELQEQIPTMQGFFQDLIGWGESAFVGLANGSKDLSSVWEDVMNMGLQYLYKWVAAQIQAMVISNQIKNTSAQQDLTRNAATTTSDLIAGSAATFKAHASIPFVGAVIAAGLIALMLAQMKKAKKESKAVSPKVQAFATGGIVDREQFVLAGEKGPEIIAPVRDYKTEARRMHGAILQAALPDTQAQLARAGLGVQRQVDAARITNNNRGDTYEINLTTAPGTPVDQVEEFSRLMGGWMEEQRWKRA